MTTIIEGADAAANTLTAYAMTTGDEFFGSLEQGTSDWIAVTLVAGTTYSFGAMGIGAHDTGVTDPLLKLHGADGSVLSMNDDGGPGLSASLTFTAASSGIYYVEVKSLAGAAGADYGLAMTEGDRPSYGTEMGAAIIYRPGNSWAATPETPVNVTWGIRTSGPALDASGNPAPFAQLTTAQIAAAHAALANYSDVCGITFTQVNPVGTTNNATILIGAYDSTTDGAGAFASYPGATGAGAAAGDLWLNNDSVSQTSLPFGSYDYFVFLHELGHAMGLAHPGDYNAAPGVSITYANNAQFVQDSQQYSVMSYFNAVNTEPNAPQSYADTLMMYDIYAVQQLYGVNLTTRAGDSIYGFHSNTGGAYDFTVNTDPLLCIWDGAGKDTLNLSGFGGPQKIDLRDGFFSDVGGFIGNLSLALGAIIENAVGGTGADDITGNAVRNVIHGGQGADTITGGAGNDLLTGNKGADDFIFAAGSGRDTIADYSKTADFATLDSGLWSGSLTAQQVLNTYGVIRAGHLVLDFGADELVFIGVTSAAGMAGHLHIL